MLITGPGLTSSTFPKREPASRERSAVGDLAILPSNIGAVETALHFAIGLNPFTLIMGPSGWGKTHLLHCVTEKLSQRFRPAPRVISTMDWLGGAPAPHPTLPLLLDDVQEAVIRPRSRLQLRLALERRIRANRPTLLAITAARRTRHLNAFLPKAKDWAIGVIGEPASSEKVLVITQLAEAEGLVLSAALTKVIASKMRGNGWTLIGALRRLSQHGPLWNDVGGTLKACGVLEPFFADSGTWDLRAHILGVSRGFRAPDGVDLKDLMAFTMLREAALCEVDVARSLKIEPGDAYARCARFERRCRESDREMEVVRSFCEKVVEGLISD